jgi:hypothetical protein
VAASLCTVPFNNDAGAFNGNFEARPGGVSFDFLVEPEAQIDAAGAHGRTGHEEVRQGRRMKALTPRQAAESPLRTEAQVFM